MKYNKLSFATISLPIIAFILLLIWPDIKTVLLVTIICIIISIISIILGLISKKQIKETREKGIILSMIGTFLSFFILAIGIFEIIGLTSMNNIDYANKTYCTFTNLTKNCVKNNDGTATCVYANAFEIKCSSSILKKEQFK